MSAELAVQEGAAFFLKHHGKSKAVYGRDFAAEHLFYVARDSAASFVFAQHMPTDTLHAARFMQSRWDSAKRKDARLWDDIILNLPFSLDEEQRKRAVLRFVEDVTRGRTPVYVAIHNDTRAPHAHIIFIDADVETTKRAFGTSESGSSYRLRWIWEQVLNEALREAGFEHLRVSRRGQAWQRRQALEAANDNPQAHLAAPKSIEQLGGVACGYDDIWPAGTRERLAGASPFKHSSLEHPVADAGAEAISFETENLRDKIDFILGLDDQLNTIVAKREAIEQHRRDYKQAGQELANTEQRIQQLQLDFRTLAVKHQEAIQGLKRHKRLFGLLLVGVRIGRFASHRRIAAENAQALADTTASIAASKKMTLEKEIMHLASLQRARKIMESSAQAIKDSIAINGDDKDMELAYQVHKHSLATHLASLDWTTLNTGLVRGELNEHKHLRLANLHRMHIEQPREMGWGNGMAH